MVPQPYFNEPGYESSMHSETGRKQDRGVHGQHSGADDALRHPGAAAQPAAGLRRRRPHALQVHNI